MQFSSGETKIQSEAKIQGERRRNLEFNTLNEKTIQEQKYQELVKNFISTLPLTETIPQIPQFSEYDFDWGNLSIDQTTIFEQFKDEFLGSVPGYKKIIKPHRLQFTYKWSNKRALIAKQYFTYLIKTQLIKLAQEAGICEKLESRIECNKGIDCYWFEPEENTSAGEKKWETSDAAAFKEGGKCYSRSGRDGGFEYSNAGGTRKLYVKYDNEQAKQNKKRKDKRWSDMKYGRRQRKGRATSQLWSYLSEEKKEEKHEGTKIDIENPEEKEAPKRTSLGHSPFAREKRKKKKKEPLYKRRDEVVLGDIPEAEEEEEKKGSGFLYGGRKRIKTRRKTRKRKTKRKRKKRKTKKRKSRRKKSTKRK